MRSIADKWWNEERRDLFRATEVVASRCSDATRLSTSLDTILNDLELYEDPRQGAGAWLFDNELKLADRLGEQLRNVVGNERPVEAGATALASDDWPTVQAMAAALLSAMRANGDFTS